MWDVQDVQEYLREDKMVKIATIYYNKVTKETHISYESALDTEDSMVQYHILTDSIDQLDTRKHKED